MSARNEPFNAAIGTLLKSGYTQAQIAGAAGISPQYLSDIRSRRRPLSELIARRIAEKFALDHRWLMGVQEIEVPQSGLASGSESTGGSWLPVFPHPIEGNPILHRSWEGTYVQVPTMATSRLNGAVHPYVLRFRNDDVKGRLHKNDLVLISQSPKDSARIVVVKVQNKCLLCRRKGRSWIRVATGAVLTDDCDVVGHCVGVLWSALD